MADIEYRNTYSPASLTEIDFEASRNGGNVIITAFVSTTLLYSDGFINYDGEITFNLWSGAVSNSVNIKDYSERWTVGSPRTRSRICSITLNVGTATRVDVWCDITTPAGRNAIAMPEQYVSIGVPSFRAPTAPTWLNISPNPCDINSSPLLTWGGATAGSLGTIYYDIEVASRKPDGSWTNWLRVGNAQSAASYREKTLKDMNIYNQKPYVGVAYQYRVRTSDGVYAVSEWKYVTLNVTFVSPAAPTSITYSSSSVKKDESIIVRWSGGNGGSGTITKYNLDYRIYNHTTQTWGNWTNIYNGTGTSYTFNVGTVYPTSKNGDMVQFRVRILNSWNQYTGYYNAPSSVIIRGNQIWIKINGNWVEGECYIKTENVWKEGTPYIKINGTWKETT